jgi:hypothetical protein
VQQACVGEDGVAGLEHDDVAGDQLARLDVPLVAVADHAGRAGRERAEREERSLGAALLERANAGVDEDDDEHHHRVGVVAER